MKPADIQALAKTLKARFEANPKRHATLTWGEALAGLEAKPKAWPALAWMEASGGEPDVLAFDSSAKTICFVDCCAESPEGRRSLCYDDAALAARKEAKPAGSALGVAASMGVRLLNEAEYRDLQRFGPFDQKTSSWIETPDSVRKLGGALFCDYRYGQVFTYHNGVQSYYAARGFRAILRL
ncbi:DUF4256 domain-containing protein [Ahniella affigens]|uniref:DUF4256 domain-containing protein n=1 Tax=Ahniella affigens TaxID=2021234 RepID=A0A2P1PZ70_9GAMM|nr:DUF4256 domain-containing protein [Ahniella affigens]AVQ00138.1 DUF4256 domain-containing protein [Ahniella affigens]